MTPTDDDAGRLHRQALAARLDAWMGGQTERPAVDACFHLNVAPAGLAAVVAEHGGLTLHGTGVAQTVRRVAT